MDLSRLLIEGKKETLIDRYKTSLDIDEFENILTNLIDSDPTVTKKYSEWMINEFIRMVKSKSYSDESDEIVSKILEGVKEFNDLHQSISEKDTISLDDMINSYRNRGISYFTNTEQKRVVNSPKDINSYPSIWSVLLMNKIIKERKELERLETEAKKDVEKPYEDDRFLIVIPHTYVASCFYGANTKWCTASREKDTHFKSYSKDGRLIYIIDKKSSSNLFGKMAIHQDKSGNLTVWDQQDGLRTLQFLLDRFDGIKNEINEVLNRRDDYSNLLKLKQGKIPRGYATLSSPYFVRFDGENVVFNFDGEIKNVLSFFDMSEDEAWEHSMALSSHFYDNYYYDGYQATEDMREGYILYSFTQEHLTLLKEILDILNPTLSECITNKDGILTFSNDCSSSIGEFLLDLNNKDINEVMEIYTIAQENSMSEGVKQEIIREYCNIFEDIGLVLMDKDSCFFEYEIEIDKLIGYYEENLEYFKDKPIDEVLKSVVESKLYLPISSPREIAYEVADSKVFEDEFNVPVTDTLKSFLDSLEEGDEFSNFNGYMKILTQIKNNYGFNKWIKLKGIDGDYRIKLNKLDPTDNRVEFNVRNFETGQTKSGNAKLGTINSLINNTAMFDPFFDD